MSNLTIDFLRHILSEIQFLISETSDLKFNDFIKNEVQKRAYVRSLEIIGEAVKNLPNQLLDNYPTINLKGAARMRDRLIHGYFDIDYAIVWDVIKKDIPILKNQIIFLIEDLEKSK
jgi:uncharacterized protein with HEPN domain